MGVGSVEPRSSALAHYTRGQVVARSESSAEHKDPLVGDSVLAPWAFSRELVVSQACFLHY